MLIASAIEFDTTERTQVVRHPRTLESADVLIIYAVLQKEGPRCGHALAPSTAHQRDVGVTANAVIVDPQHSTLEVQSHVHSLFWDNPSPRSWTSTMLLRTPEHCGQAV